MVCGFVVEFAFVARVLIWVCLRCLLACVVVAIDLVLVSR